MPLDNIFNQLKGRYTVINIFIAKVITLIMITLSIMVVVIALGQNNGTHAQLPDNVAIKGSN